MIFLPAPWRPFIKKRNKRKGKKENSRWRDEKGAKPWLNGIRCSGVFVHRSEVRVLVYVHVSKCEKERKRLSGVAVDTIGFNSVRWRCPSKHTAKGGHLIGRFGLKVTGRGQSWRNGGWRSLKKGSSQTQVLQCCVQAFNLGSYRISHCQKCNIWNFHWLILITLIFYLTAFEQFCPVVLVS